MDGGTIAGIVVAVLIAAAVIFILIRRKRGGTGLLGNKGSSKNPLLGDINWRKVPVGWVARSTDTKQRTNLGITVYSKSGVDAATLQMIDQAYADEKQRAIDEGGYTEFPAFSQIEIYVTPAPILSPESRTPSLLVRADRSWEAGQYDQHWQTKYDAPRPSPENPNTLHYSEPDDCAVICCAESVWGLSTAGSQPPILRFDINADIMYEGCKNAFSHDFIALNDAEWFWTQNGPDHQHPIPYRRLATMRQLLGNSNIRADGAALPKGTTVICPTR